MIYGRNFNGQPIPDNVKRMFRARRRTFSTNVDVVGSNSTQTHRVYEAKIFSLVGVCNTKPELDAMVVQADNGNREFKFMANFTVKGEQWYAIYTD